VGPQPHDVEYYLLTPSWRCQSRLDDARRWRGRISTCRSATCLLRPPFILVNLQPRENSPSSRPPSLSAIRRSRSSSICTASSFPVHFNPHSGPDRSHPRNFRTSICWSPSSTPTASICCRGRACAPDSAACIRATDFACPCSCCAGDASVRKRSRPACGIVGVDEDRIVARRHRPSCPRPLGARDIQCAIPCAGWHRRRIADVLANCPMILGAHKPSVSFQRPIFLAVLDAQAAHRRATGARGFARSLLWSRSAFSGPS